ncbi:MAG: oligosaccharide flippase family protein, partial [FCB group bacterium]|nr:oligosaccharide flippase family protein [FCB group bacterium]
MLKTSFVNLFLRALTLASKFVLLLFIARYLSPEEMGVWGLMNVTVALSLYFLGMDFYVFNTREILAQDQADRMPLIRDQFVFHGLAYVVILPILTGVFWLELIAWKYIGWFYFLLILEHLSQECSRLLITLSRPAMANLVLFLRSGAWIYVVVATTYLKADLRGLPAIWMGWGIGVVFSVVLTAWALRRMPWENSNRISINWAWMRKGVKVSLPFFFATMSFVAIQYIDRYFLQHFWGEAVVGIYTFFASIANTISVFIFTGVIMILYPKIISAYQQGDLIRYKTLMRKMSLGIIGGIIVLSALAVLLIDPVLILIDKSVYVGHRQVFFIMLGTTSLLSL